MKKVFICIYILILSLSAFVRKISEYLKTTEQTQDECIRLLSQTVSLQEFEERLSSLRGINPSPYRGGCRVDFPLVCAGTTNFIKVLKRYNSNLFRRVSSGGPAWLTGTFIFLKWLLNYSDNKLNYLY